MPGKVIKRPGNALYLKQTDKGIWKRPLNQLQQRLPEISTIPSTVMTHHEVMLMITNMI